MLRGHRGNAVAGLFLCSTRFPVRATAGAPLVTGVKWRVRRAAVVSRPKPSVIAIMRLLLAADRMYFQYATVGVLPVERITGRTVRSFLSSTDTEVDGLSMETFVLHPRDTTARHA